jgi:hypothetical protein
MDDASHVWSNRNKPHRIEQDGRSIFLRQCLLCRRDFAQGIDGSAWRAVYIGVFKVELLANAVNERWLNEECPKQRLPNDDQARMTRSRQDFRPTNLSSD